MGTFSLSHWLIVLVVILILFGAGRIPAAMGDLGEAGRSCLGEPTSPIDRDGDDASLHSDAHASGPQR